MSIPEIIGDFAKISAALMRAVGDKSPFRKPQFRS
jgi:hypothetical protein